MTTCHSNSSFFELSDEQLDVISRLKNGCILCGGVGSGKSRTAIGYFYQRMGGDLYSSKYKKPLTPKPLYIITTARKRDTKEWEPELIMFFPEIDKYQITIDSWNNIKKYVEVTDSYFIFDEQRVVGKGEWVKSFLKIAKNNEWILATATPGDSWSDYIPVFIANGFYRNRTEFLRRHAIYSRYTKFPSIEKYVGTGVLQKYRKDILIMMNYKSEKEKVVKRIVTGYDKENYKLVTKKRWDIYQNKPVQNIASLGYLARRVVNSDPSRVAVVEMLAAAHPKVIIFYSYDYELELLKNAKYNEETKISEWNGHQHDPIPETSRWVYLVNYAAGSEGWNCTETDTIIFYSQNYSYKTMMQAQGRIDRRDSLYNTLYYYHLVSDSPIDRAITFSLQKKKDFNEYRYFKNLEESSSQKKHML